MGATSLLWGEDSVLVGVTQLPLEVTGTLASCGLSILSMPESLPDNLCCDVFLVSGDSPPYKVVVHSFFSSLGLI